DKAIHMLQTEVTALCQEIKSLQKNSHSSYKNHFLSFLTSWPWLWFIKSIAKHIFLNVCIFTLLFIVLRRRKSPIALAIVHHVGPRLKDFMHYLFDTTVFWKVTV
ncbi:hypothetical protein BDF20DRAFT_799143, partial [Mycotypha africana]|uniref:uncharacterized protein n=1 Tax=Mycotypha africana TaxID=64632 RepID=UPI002301CCE5